MDIISGINALVLLRVLFVVVQCYMSYYIQHILHSIYVIKRLKEIQISKIKCSNNPNMNLILTLTNIVNPVIYEHCVFLLKSCVGYFYEHLFYKC